MLEELKVFPITAVLFVDIEVGVMGRSLGIDEDRGRLLIGTENGSVLSRSLSDSSNLLDLLIGDGSDESGIHAIAVDDYGTIWAAGYCTVHYRTMGASDWTEYDYCQTQNIETPSDILIMALPEKQPPPHSPAEFI